MLPKSASKFSILTVCTGNICRSPLAEVYLREGLKNLGAFNVGSAGVGALVGQPMDENSQALALKRSLNLDPIPLARQIGPEMIGASDLILGMDRGHRTWILERYPRVKKKVFTIHEFAELIRNTSEEDLRMDIKKSAPKTLGEVLGAALASVRLSRGAVEPTALGATEDIVDPYRQSPEVFEAMDLHLAPCCEVITDFFQELVGQGYSLND